MCHYLGCNDGIGGFREKVAIFRDQKSLSIAKSFISSKDSCQKMQFINVTKKMASLDPFLKSAKWREIPTEQAQNMLESKCSYSTSPKMGADMQKWLYWWTMSRDQILAFLTSPRQSDFSFSLQNKRFRVPIQISIDRLLQKSFQLRLHCYTLSLVITTRLVYPSEWGIFKSCLAPIATQ